MKYTKDESNIFYFSIRKFYKRNKDPNRLLVIIYCNNIITGEVKRNTYYTSISDGSYWRFCVKRDDSNSFEKGYNYISSTFCNIYIQKFISETIQDSNIEIDPDSNIKCDITSELNEYLKNRLLNNTYNTNNKFFNIINFVFPPVVYITDYNDCVVRLLQSLSQYISNPNFDKMEYEIDMLSNLFCLLNKYNLIIKSTEESRRIFFNNIRDIFIEIFQKYFDIETTTKTLIYQKIFSVGEYHFKSDIYSVVITHKKDNKQYILYYMHYKTIKMLYSIKTIIHIVPLGSELNIYMD